MDEQPAPRRGGRLRQLAWLVAIWTASVAALGVVAALLRLLMNALGMGQ